MAHHDGAAGEWEDILIFSTFTFIKQKLKLMLGLNLKL